MAKKNLHPSWYNTKIYCDGKKIMEIGGTLKEMHIDVWSGNHPFYTGTQKYLDVDGRVTKFSKKYKNV